ncbi:alpha/beta hydrolase [Sulfurimonas sp.]|nr:alpha/beta hydrolase [Sulfurimonas sp.]
MTYIILTVIILFISAFLFYYIQYYFTFKPSIYREMDLDNEFEILHLKMDDGVTIEGVIYEPLELYRKLPSIHGTLLYFGGNYQDVIGLIKKMAISYPHVRIVTFNYRSFGKSGGRASEKKIFSDAIIISEFTKEKYGDFYIMGYSLGAGVASFIAANIKAKGVFLIGPFDSFYGHVKERFSFFKRIPKLNLSRIFRYKFDNTTHVSKIESKTYIFASKSDKIMYIKNIRNLKEYVKNLAMYEEFDELTHYELLWDKDILKIINGVMSE